MKARKIKSFTLTENVLPDIIVERTFYDLPEALQKVYHEKKSEGIKIAIGLDMDLGFYLIQASPHQIKLLWWENHFYAKKVLVA